ncbi:uncharacterized protein TRIREDRAFT_50536, partial [Trichoderma reesei QM6a]
MSPDAVSLLFPDRPIRPLPKRRLRERLPPEVANSIKYPSYIHDHIPLFYYPSYTTKDDNGAPPPTSTASAMPHHHADSRRHSTLRRHGAAMTVGINEELRGSLVLGSTPRIQGMVIQSSVVLDPIRQTMEFQLVPSAASSVDGYESFENTNNKKKRKIPTTGDSLASNGLSLSSDVTALSTAVRSQSPAKETDNNKGQLLPPNSVGNGSYVPGSQGLSGPGRGRLGRSSNGRSPLRALSDGSNAWSSRSKATGQNGGGIISNAIATAGKEPLQGQENRSLLQQRGAADREIPTSSQFTFTCESQTPGAIQWPGKSHSTSLQHLPAGAPASPGQREGNSSKQVSRVPASSSRKTRSRLEKELAAAARTRRQIATENYYHNLVNPEDIWICEFCEYERIFGEPPRTLIRDYEIKDRRQRQEEADRKRLLEKAKAKSRKGKKAGKAAAKGGHTSEHVPDQ